jgi:hypothetical protein
MNPKIRSPKSEVRNNLEMLNLNFTRFEFPSFLNSDLFRASKFDFRIFKIRLDTMKVLFAVLLSPEKRNHFLYTSWPFCRHPL